jgi:hypothetical protein
VSSSAKWEDVNSCLAVFLAVSELDVAIAHFEKIKKSLAEITMAIEKVRGSENAI